MVKESTFEAILDETFERLSEKQIQYSVQRIKEMDEELVKLENELNVFLGLRLVSNRPKEQPY